jgi:hypothetical protein
MKTLTTVFVVCAALPLMADTWKDVPLVDSNCSAKVKTTPDQHTRQCALGCAKSGFGVLAADGSYLKFDDAGNGKALAALRATKKTDHLRATVTGKRSGESIQVESITLD